MKSGACDEGSWNVLSVSEEILCVLQIFNERYDHFNKIIFAHPYLLKACDGFDFTFHIYLLVSFGFRQKSRAEKEGWQLLVGLLGCLAPAVFNARRLRGPSHVQQMQEHAARERFEKGILTHSVYVLLFGIWATGETDFKVKRDRRHENVDHKLTHKLTRTQSNFVFS